MTASFNRIRILGGGNGCTESRPIHTSSRDWHPRVSDLASGIKSPFHRTLSTVLSGQPIQCAAKEFAVIQPPPGYSCASYLDPFVASAGGYLGNPDAGSDCLYCSASTADAWLYRMFNIQYAHRWRNVGLFCAFIVFNVRRCLFLSAEALTVGRADLCHVCIHVSFPHPVLWKVQGRRQPLHFTRVGCLEAVQEDAKERKGGGRFRSR